MCGRHDPSVMDELMALPEAQELKRKYEAGGFDEFGHGSHSEYAYQLVKLAADKGFDMGRFGTGCVQYVAAA